MDGCVLAEMDGWLCFSWKLAPSEESFLHERFHSSLRALLLSSILQLATTTTTPLRRHEWRMVEEEEFLVELQEHHKHAHVVTIPSAQHYQIITMIIIIIYTGV